jgi:hypothetical protein
MALEAAGERLFHLDQGRSPVVDEGVQEGFAVATEDREDDERDGERGDADDDETGCEASGARVRRVQCAVLCSAGSQASATLARQRRRYRCRVVSGRREWALAGVAIAGAASLLLPWARTGDRTRSSLDLASSASALDVVTGWQRVAMFVGWFAVVAGAAVGLVCVAWDRPRWAVCALAVVGPGLLIAVAAAVASPFALEWGVWLASGLGATASIGSGLVVLTHVSMREGSRT